MRRIRSGQLDGDIIADIPMAPFASIIAILLACSLYVASVVPAGFEKELHPTWTEPYQIRVEISRDNQLTIDGAPTNVSRVYADMKAAIEAHCRRGHSTHIAVYANQNASWKPAISVLDAGREAGDDDIVFVMNWRRMAAEKKPSGSIAYGAAWRPCRGRARDKNR